MSEEPWGRWKQAPQNVHALVNLTGYCSYGKGSVPYPLLHLQDTRVYFDTGNLLSTIQREALKKLEKLREYRHLK